MNANLFRLALFVILRQHDESLRARRKIASRTRLEKNRERNRLHQRLWRKRNSRKVTQYNRRQRIKHPRKRAYITTYHVCSDCGDRLRSRDMVQHRHLGIWLCLYCHSEHVKAKLDPSLARVQGEQVSLSSPDRNLILKESMTLIRRRLTAGKLKHLDFLLSGEPAKTDSRFNGIRYRVSRQADCYMESSLMRIFLCAFDLPQAWEHPVPTRVIAKFKGPMRQEVKPIDPACNVTVLDGFLFDKVVRELLAEGYQKTAVGTYVKGSQQVQTCGHRYDQTKFCVVTISKSSPPEHPHFAPS